MALYNDGPDSQHFIPKCKQIYLGSPGISCGHLPSPLSLQSNLKQFCDAQVYLQQKYLSSYNHYNNAVM